MKILAVVLLVVGVALILLLFYLTQMKKKEKTAPASLEYEKPSGKTKKDKKEKTKKMPDKELKKAEDLSNNTRIRKKGDVNPTTETLTTLLDFSAEDASAGEYRTELLSEEEIKDTDENIIKDVLFESGSLAPDGEILNVKVAGTGILTMEDRTELLEDVESSAFEPVDEQDDKTQLLFDDDFGADEFGQPEETEILTEDQTEIKKTGFEQGTELLIQDDAPIVEESAKQERIPEEGTMLLVQEDAPIVEATPNATEEIPAEELHQEPPAAGQKQFIGQTIDGNAFTIEEGMLFAGCRLKHLDLAEATIPGVTIIDSTLEDISFLGADLSGLTCSSTSFYRCSFKYASLKNATLTGIKAESCNMEKTEFDDSLLHMAVFTGCKLDSKTSFEGAVIKACDIEGLSATQLSNATII